MIRVLLAGVATAGLLAMGTSPALAAKDKKSDDDSVVTAAAEGGNGGHAGNGGLGLNVCPGIGLLAKGEASCGAGNGGSADGGDADAYAEDDSRDSEEG